MEKNLQQFQERRRLAQSGGGADRIKQQHEKEKATARERIAVLLDEGSFTEIGLFAGSVPEGAEIENPAEGVVTGCGTVEGKRVYLFAQDYTVAGGAVGEIHAAKICRILDLAGENGAPVIGLYDSAGVRVDEGLGALEGYGSILSRQALYSGVIPQIAVVMGPCAGGAAFLPALTDLVVMVEGSGAIFVTGPQVIAAVTGEDTSVEEIGDARVHGSMSGAAHLLAGDDTAALKSVRSLMSYLPPNNLEDPPAAEPRETDDREELLQIVSGEGKPYDVREVIRRVVDMDSFLELHGDYAENAVIGFARLDGGAVGIVANQPLVKDGCLDIDAAAKIARFVRFCDSFNLPLFTFVDLPGYLPGVAQEQGGIVRHGAKVFYAYAGATVPKISLVLGRAYGSAAVAMSSRSLGADLCLAWPSAEIAVLGPGGAAKAGDKAAGPYAAAARGWIDEIIDPRESRDHLRRALLAAGNKRSTRPPRKHGNIPL